MSGSPIPIICIYDLSGAIGGGDYAAGMGGCTTRNLQIVLNTPENPYLNQAIQKNSCQIVLPKKFAESKFSNSKNSPVSRGSRINTDPRIFFGFLLLNLKSPFLCFRVIQTGYYKSSQISIWKVFFVVKIILLWKMLPIPVKQWKPVWIRACPRFPEIRSTLGLQQARVGSLDISRFAIAICYRGDSPGRNIDFCMSYNYFFWNLNRPSGHTPKVLQN